MDVDEPSNCYAFSDEIQVWRVVIGTVQLQGTLGASPSRRPGLGKIAFNPQTAPA